MSGCASQGGGKLDHDQVIAGQQLNSDTIQVCAQSGSVMNCHIENREQYRDELEYQFRQMNYER
jgi:hypothetical protein